MTIILFYLSFFLITLESVIGPETSHTDDSTKNPHEILPIIFIEYNNEYLYPTRVTQGTFTKKLSFSSKDHNDDRFFCPAETPNQREKIQTGLKLSEEYPKLKEFHQYIKEQHPEYEEYLKYLQFSQHCLFEKSFGRKESLTCPEEPSFAIRKLTQIKADGEQEDKPCGPDGVGKLYEFFYLACPVPTFINQLHLTSWKVYATNADFRKYLSELPFLTVKHVAYRFCYDHNKMDTIYTKHRLRSEEIMFDDKIQYEREKSYDMITEDYGFFDANQFEKIKDIYKKVESLTKEESSIKKEDSDGKLPLPTLQYRDHKLVSHGDFSTALWRKPTYQYLNTKPILKSLFELWDYLEKLLRIHFQELKMEPDIYTGAFITNSNTENPVEYVYENEIQVPDKWIKLIYDHDKKWSSHYGTAITMLNYKVDKPDPDCPKDLCYPFIDDGIIEKKFPGAGNQICCERIEDKHLKYFNLNLHVDGALMFHSLSYDKNKSNDALK